MVMRILGEYTYLYVSTVYQPTNCQSIYVHLAVPLKYYDVIIERRSMAEVNKKLKSCLIGYHKVALLTALLRVVTYNNYIIIL